MLHMLKVSSRNFNIISMSMLQGTGKGLVSNSTCSNPYNICTVHFISFSKQFTDNPFFLSWWPFFSLSHSVHNFRHIFYPIPTTFKTLSLQTVCTSSLVIFHAHYHFLHFIKFGCGVINCWHHLLFLHAQLCQ